MPVAPRAAPRRRIRFVHVAALEHELVQIVAVEIIQGLVAAADRQRREAPHGRDAATQQRRVLFVLLLDLARAPDAEVQERVERDERARDPVEGQNARVRREHAHGHRAQEQHVDASTPRERRECREAAAAHEDLAGPGRRLDAEPEALHGDELRARVHGRRDGRRRENPQAPVLVHVDPQRRRAIDQRHEAARGHVEHVAIDDLRLRGLVVAVEEPRHAARRQIRLGPRHRLHHPQQRLQNPQVHEALAQARRRVELAEEVVEERVRRARLLAGRRLVGVGHVW
mmetsp:Transcript_25886/g.84820  ORF Transcript_25886/g.84820 Transcript_25886/m.84820 type:complete len:285 (-) Transcript_25886:9-863(-)